MSFTYHHPVAGQCCAIWPVLLSNFWRCPGSLSETGHPLFIAHKWNEQRIFIIYNLHTNKLWLWTVFLLTQFLVLPGEVSVGKARVYEAVWRVLESSTFICWFRWWPCSRRQCQPSGINCILAAGVQFWCHTTETSISFQPDSTS